MSKLKYILIPTIKPVLEPVVKTLLIPLLILSPIIILGLLMGLQGCRSSRSLSPMTYDLSNRCSVVDKVEIAGFENDFCGFVPADKEASLSLADKVDGWSTAVYEGSHSLKVSYPDSIKASAWQCVAKNFDTPLDLTQSPIMEYGILAAEGPGRDFVTRLTLSDSDGKTFQAESHIIPTLWRSVVFDLHQCPFLKEVASLKIEIMNDSEEPWHNSWWMLDGIAAGKPLDLNFEVEDSEQRFEAEGTGKISRVDDALRFEFDPGAVLSLELPKSHNVIYNPEFKRRNTIVLSLQNQSTASGLRLWFVSDSAMTYTQENSKVVTLPQDKDIHQLYYNLSDLPGAKGHLQGLRMEPVDGNGEILLYRIAFEREEPITENCGIISSCRATDKNIIVSGELDPKYAAEGASIEIRHQPLYKTELPFDSLELIATLPTTLNTKTFTINDIPNSRLAGKMTHLSSRFRAALRGADGSVLMLGSPFFVENWREFASNPYEFEDPKNDFYVSDFGAKGDGVTNDNPSIQRAIDAASRKGGGNVILSGDTTVQYGRQYLATNLELKSGVNLVIEKGAVLRQSPYFKHYQTYQPEYGHDNVIPGVPWTHCMYTNMPLILAKDIERVKIKGGGEIRMDDTYSENPAWTHYARNCSDRIHVVPIAVCNTSHVEISDIDIRRCSNYHTIFYRADSVFIGNLKMQEVACLSGDGLSFGNAVTNVRVERCVFESNDDGIVLCSSYKDPRGGNWRQRVDTIDSSVRHIEVYHSYIDCARGGGGKAIALIPWGSTNPRQDYNEIDNIEVRDCVLRGGNSVGCWADNPFDGKPFTNTEENDYAPVKNLRIFDNEYLSNCYLFGVEPTTLLTDCGLKGTSTLKNPEFTDRLAYWTADGQIEADPGVVKIGKGILYQGLWLTPGKYRIHGNMRPLGNIFPFVTHYGTGEQILINDDHTLNIENEGVYLVGVSGTQVLLYSLFLDKIST